MPVVGARRQRTYLIRYLWQLPQHLLGLVLLLFVRHRTVRRERRGVSDVAFCFSDYGGISLGRYVFVHRDASPQLVAHELGHCRQSLMLGPLYLLVVGLPSMGWAILYPLLARRRPQLDYYAFFTERWANRLVGRAGRR